MIIKPGQLWSHVYFLDEYQEMLLICNVFDLYKIDVISIEIENDNSEKTVCRKIYTKDLLEKYYELFLDS